jgi:hypothetical protein
MTDQEQKKFYETLEAVAVAQGLQLLIQQTEQTPSDDPAHMAMLTFFRSLLTKYRRKVGTVRLKKDDYGQVELIDDTLRTFNKN